MNQDQERAHSDLETGSKPTIPASPALEAERKVAELEAQVSNVISAELEMKVRNRVNIIVKRELAGLKKKWFAIFGISNFVVLLTLAYGLWKATDETVRTVSSQTSSNMTVAEVAKMTTAVSNKVVDLEGFIEGAKLGVPKLTSDLVTKSGEMQAKFERLKDTFFALSADTSNYLGYSVTISNQVVALSAQVLTLSNDVRALNGSGLADAVLVVKALRKFTNESQILKALAPPEWKALALTNGYFNHGVGHPPLQYQRDGLGIVRLRGLIDVENVKGNSPVIAQLPTNCWPKEPLILSATLHKFLVGRINILPDGSISASWPEGYDKWISFADIQFGTH